MRNAETQQAIHKATALLTDKMCKTYKSLV